MVFSPKVNKFIPQGSPHLDQRTGVEVSTMGPKDDVGLISLAKKMGGSS